MIPPTIIKDAIANTRPFTEEERNQVLQAINFANQAHRALMVDMEKMRKFDKWSIYGLAALSWICGFCFGFMWK